MNHYATKEKFENKNKNAFYATFWCIFYSNVTLPVRMTTAAMKEWSTSERINFISWPLTPFSCDDVKAPHLKTLHLHNQKSVDVKYRECRNHAILKCMLKNVSSLMSVFFLLSPISHYLLQKFTNYKINCFREDNLKEI